MVILPSFRISSSCSLAHTKRILGSGDSWKYPVSEADSSTGDGCVSAPAAFAFRLPFYKREGRSPAPRLQPVSPCAPLRFASQTRFLPHVHCLVVQARPLVSALCLGRKTWLERVRNAGTFSCCLRAFSNQCITTEALETALF